MPPVVTFVTVIPLRLTLPKSSACPVVALLDRLLVRDGSHLTMFRLSVHSLEASQPVLASQWRTS